MIVSILNQKGGVGKTTIAVNLACALNASGQNEFECLLVDSDPQGSTRDWNALSKNKHVDTIGLDRPSIEKDIQSHAKRYNWTIIDGAPGTASNPWALSCATIRCSDIILIPVKPSDLDYYASEALVDMIKALQMRYGESGYQQNLKAAFIISQQITRSRSVQMIHERLASFELPIFNAYTCNRLSYVYSINEGQSVIHTNDKVAAQEIYNLANELKEFAR